MDFPLIALAGLVDVTRKGSTMRYFVTFIILVLGLSALGFRIHDTEQALREVESYIVWAHRNVNIRHQNRAMQYAPLVVHWAEQRALDPILLAVIVNRESTWRTTAIGSIGELGLMQVKNYMTKHIDQSTPSGQIEAGTLVLKVCMDKCNGITEQALTCYATKTGRCKPGYSGLKRSMRLYREAIQRHRIYDE